MEYTRLGKSGLKVSRLCLGCMTYGSPAWREWVLDETASRPFIRKALDLGINFFDSAQGYGFGSPFRPNLPFADHPPLYIVWLAIPVTLLLKFAETVDQLCQPPVFAIEKLTTGVAVGLSSTTCTSPLTPG
jgi:hypothetical protein